MSATEGRATALVGISACKFLVHLYAGASVISHYRTLFLSTLQAAAFPIAIPSPFPIVSRIRLLVLPTRVMDVVTAVINAKEKLR
jgi:hypothetical protein